MLWLLLLIPAGLIALSIYFERKRKVQTEGKDVKDERAVLEEIYITQGAGNKSNDPKLTKNL
ncbi:hypothetical protein EQV77_12875 [Halobacillus fulvus]|nr:hypothetical protein EQV77_12875 [Halobacillus fulvus]